MGDQASAIQEALQRARQLAAKMSVKRTASEIEDPNIGTVKVTLAYEPSKTDQNRQSSHRDNNNSPSIHTNRDNNNYSSSSSSIPSKGDREQRGSSADERIEIIIPHAVIGLVIGKGGDNIKRIQNETRATVRVDPNTVDEKGNKVCTITGTKQAVEEAHRQVASVIENAATNKRPRLQVEGSDQYKMRIPASRTGAIIGKGGETIKSIKQQSGCDIELDKNSRECSQDESVFIIRGTQEKILKARAMIEARLASRGRDNPNQTTPKGVATGANAAPVAQFTDLPVENTDMSAAWAAYFAQYSNLFNQTGTQPGLMASSAQIPSSQVSSAQVSSTQVSSSQVSSGQTHQQDYSDEWIEYYLKNGRADYAEQIIEMKKQQQAQKQQQQQQD